MALRRWVAVASLAAGLWAGQAAACPACAGRDNDNPNRVAFFLGAMILLPWTVSAAVILTLRKLQQEAQGEVAEGPAASAPIHHGDVNEP